MSSVGIPEGSEFKGSPCTCFWVSTASIPPISRLEKKCDYCKQQENDLTSKEKPMKNAIEILENSEKIIKGKLAEVNAALANLMEQQAGLETQLSDISEALKQLKGSDESE